MISFLSGILVHRSPTELVIDCNGIGYAVHISLTTFGKLPASGAVKVLTHQHFTENNQQLFGFYEEHERALFRQLISVSGIGPNTALLMLSSMEPNEIHRAIVNEREDLLVALKGIGAKTAKRLIVELKDKLMKTGMKTEAMPAGNFPAHSEALTALISLGFNRISSENALAKAARETDQHQGVEELIKLALRNL